MSWTRMPIWARPKTGIGDSFVTRLVMVSSAVPIGTYTVQLQRRWRQLHEKQQASDSTLDALERPQFCSLTLRGGGRDLFLAVGSNRGRQLRGPGGGIGCFHAVRRFLRQPQGFQAQQLCLLGLLATALKVHHFLRARVCLGIFPLESPFDIPPRLG